MREQELVIHEAEGRIINQRDADGYVDATGMCKEHGKLWAHYWATSATKKFIAALSRSIGIPIDLLVDTINKGPNENRGTWVHPLLAEHLALWISEEYFVRVVMYLHAKRNGGDTEETANLLAQMAQTNAEQAIQYAKALSIVQDGFQRVKDEYARKEKLLPQQATQKANAEISGLKRDLEKAEQKLNDLCKDKDAYISSLAAQILELKHQQATTEILDKIKRLEIEIGNLTNERDKLQQEVASLTKRATNKIEKQDVTIKALCKMLSSSHASETSALGAARGAIGTILNNEERIILELERHGILDVRDEIKKRAVDRERKRNQNGRHYQENMKDLKL